MPEPSIATRIKNARTTLGLSQAEAAHKWGLSKRTLQHWEQCQRRPSGLYLKLVIQILAKVEKNAHLQKRKKR